MARLRAPRVLSKTPGPAAMIYISIIPMISKRFNWTGFLFRPELTA